MIAIKYGVETFFMV